MIVIQAEVAKELINNNDATIQGILMAVIVILIVTIGLLWKSKLQDEKYIREQDKETLKILLELTNTLKDVQDSDKEMKTGFAGIKETVVDSNNKLSSLYNVIHQKLLNMGK